MKLPCTEVLKDKPLTADQVHQLKVSVSKSIYLADTTVF